VLVFLVDIKGDLLGIVIFGVVNDKIIVCVIDVG